jgi:hypothetical protein
MCMYEVDKRGCLLPRIQQKCESDVRSKDKTHFQIRSLQADPGGIQLNSWGRRESYEHTEHWYKVSRNRRGRKSTICDLTVFE